MGFGQTGNADLEGLLWHDLLARLDGARDKYADAIDAGTTADIADALRDLLRICRFVDETIANRNFPKT
jgi:hypothetical protein